MKHIININLPDNINGDNGEELKKLYDVLYFRTDTPSKRKKSKLYLTTDDIERLNDRFSVLFKKVRTDVDLSPAQIEKECAYLSEKYDFEIQLLSDSRESDYLEQQAKINAKYDEQTPWRRCCLWALLFQPLTNRAQDIIEERAALDAEERFAPLERELEERAKKLFGENVCELSERKRRRLMKKYLKIKRKLVGDVAEPGTTASGNIPSETPENAAAPALPAQVSEAAEPAPGACDAVHHVDDVDGKLDENDLDNVSEPPEPPARRPRKSNNTGA